MWPLPNVALAPGSRLGAYEVVSLLGEGGMGQVYRAKDTRLRRDVALKILPDAFASDPDRVARFQREAELLATLNHPNIAAIYGLEQADGMRALVLELAEGPTLADRIAQGPIPIDEALLIAGQIADALEAAHEKGVIHRDLKPANIKVTPDDKVKVLDFGLAKMLENPAAPAALSMSPTLSVHATYAGVILGTAAYMSPEQARGKAVDKRTDIWAFGCVLFEMLTGATPFGGEDVAEVIGAIIHKDLQWDRLPASTTTTIRTVLTRCLEKDPKKRVRDIGDVQLALDGAFESLTPSTRHARPQASARRFVSVAAIVALGIAAIIVVPLTTTIKPETPAIVTRFPIVIPDTFRFRNDARNELAISPDGRNIVFEANQQLFVRAMGDTEPKLLQASAQNIAGPTFSPDGRWVAYLSRAENKIKKTAITGGAAVTLADVPPFGNTGGFGLVWNADDFLYIGHEGAILRVPANGGTLEPIISLKPEEVAHRPQLLPDGDTLLFTMARAGENGGFGRWDKGQIVAQSLRTGRRKVLIAGGSDGRYVRTGHLLYALANTIIAVSFDLKKLQVGGPVPVIEGVRRSTAAGGGGADAQVAVADNGSMIYLAGAQTAGRNLMLTLIDQSGVRKPLAFPPAPYAAPRISPDGRRFAVQTDDGKSAALWIGDLTGTAPLQRLTFDGNSLDAVWAADSQRIAFSSDRESTGRFRIFQQPVEGRAAQRIGQADSSDAPQQLEAWSSDGKMLLFTGRVKGVAATYILSLNAPQPAELVVKSSINATISPDGHWLAYNANESGRNEVYVQPFPTTGEKHQVTADGGTHPLWSRDGRRLYFMRGDASGTRQLMATDVQTQHGFTFGRESRMPVPPTVVTGPRPYDVTPDGKTFLVMLPKGLEGTEGPAPEQINVTLDWFEDLKQRVPIK
jgi:eukaryotic-like serine/threonine-protein kinase